MAEETKKVDNVNSPSHYADHCSIECFDSMLVAWGSEKMFTHCLITAYKYLWRWEFKNGTEDTNKAEWYLNKASWIYNYCVDEDDRDKYDIDQLTHLSTILEKAKKKDANKKANF